MTLGTFGARSLRIWFSGGRGFIGGHLRRRLAAVYGREPLCLTADPAPSGGTAGAALIHVNFTSAEAISEVVEKHGVPDVFVHLGWAGMTEPESEVHLHANVLASRTLVRTLYEAGLERFIFVGSVNEYGDRAGLLREDMPAVGRLTRYAQGKAEVGRFGLEQAEKFGRIFVHVRLFYTYGAGQRESSLINTLFRCHLTGRAVDLGPCDHFRDYVYVGDVVEGLARMARMERSAVVNLGFGSAIRLREFVELFWSQLGDHPERLNFGALPKRADESEQPYSYASLENLVRLTGWRPGVPVDVGVQMTIDHLRESAGLGSPGRG